MWDSNSIINVIYPTLTNNCIIIIYFPLKTNVDFNLTYIGGEGDMIYYSFNCYQNKSKCAIKNKKFNK